LNAPRDARAPNRRDDYRGFLPITTRWMDNDVYGHVNNVTYYAYFDTAANTWLIREGGLDIHGGKVIGLVVSSGCEYRAPVAFPDAIEAGLAVERLGRSSVRYRIGIFRNSEAEACAFGHFTHVFVDRQSRSAVEIPARLRKALSRLLVDPPSG